MVREDLELLDDPVDSLINDLGLARALAAPLEPRDLACEGRDDAGSEHLEVPVSLAVGPAAEHMLDLPSCMILDGLPLN